MKENTPHENSSSADNPKRQAPILKSITLLWVIFLPRVLLGVEAASPRQTISLNGDWMFQRDRAPAEEWKTVPVPSSFQSHEGTDFHGVGWYRKQIEPLEAPKGKRVLLHFQAAATEAEVWWNGHRLGTHLGGWTPFRFDITDFVREAPAGRGHELKVRLDEKVGHNTQGFLPMVAPHFGGLWQDVSLVVVPETYCDDLELMAVGDAVSGQLQLQVALAGTLEESITNVALRCRLRSEEKWTDLSPSILASTNRLIVRAAVENPRPWSPAAPNLYEVELALPGEGGDLVRARAAFRSIEAFGQQFRLNSKPLQIRGLLNWGYSPPLVAPNPGERAWRSELELARACGFNLMKFCLWIPPQRYLELADEMGMLTWMEYPTWHPDFTAKHLDELRREFREFFRYDRNHPCVVLRSLTCETGPSAELKVIQSLYDSAHEMIPGALAEDDSSWIGWNRVHDFYDDHPYGNNHTWVKTLTGFNEYILGHGLKPLVLGEAIAADTWIDREGLLRQVRDERPWWASGVLDETARWMDQMRNQCGAAGLEQLQSDSLRYGMLMRKYQAEAYRREIPYGGYVISVIRDIPNASMGLLDYLGRPKWSAADWNWQRDTMCLLKTDGERRSFASGEPIRGQILLSHFGLNPITDGQFEVMLLSSGKESPPLQRQEEKGIGQNSGTLAPLGDFNWPAPEVATPTRFVISANLKTPESKFHNEWPVWVLPARSTNAFRDVQAHGSVAASLAHDLFPGCPRFDRRNRKGILIASRFDDDLVRFLERGGKVLLLPDGQPHSLPLSGHWFLRGAPYIPEHALSRQIPRDLFIELQHFDLAADIIPNVPQFEATDPVLLLWDTHDLKTVKTHGVIYEARAAKGRLLVSAARHTGTNNAAGKWLLGVLVEHLRSGPLPGHALPDDVWGYLKERLHADQTNLVSEIWQFKPDPKAEGLAQGWHLPKLASETDWKPIRIGAWWESQGYAELDGWGWYRLWVTIPRTWQGRDSFLSFEGVDDMYELYVNGEFVGKSGDLATRKDAFNEKKSYNITRFVKVGQKALIAVRVYDWYGAGGIFRPVTLGTLAFNPRLDFLK